MPSPADATTTLTATLRALLVEALPGAPASAFDAVDAAVALAISVIARTDAAYHDVEHTVIVTTVGARMLLGRQHLDADVRVEDWVNGITALLLHDAGYVRGALPTDQPDAYSTGIAGPGVQLPDGATDAALQPWHVDRGMRLALDQLDHIPHLDEAVVATCIDYTRFPVPDEPAYQETTSLRALVRAADLVGQLADPAYLDKLVRLHAEFREVGHDQRDGQRTPDDLRADFPRFYATQVAHHVGPALRWLRATDEGAAVVTQLEANLAAAR